MGLLDDAIREHLDLKRRRGGDPSEVARLEQEALGPVRREPEPAAADAGDAAAVEHAHDEHPESAHHEPTPDAHVHPEPHHEEPAAPADEHHEAPVPPAVHEEQISWADDLEEDHPSAAPAAEPDEDVLEETPEFLQETPEHDRLWFEQRPPRDFDFDG